MIQYGIFSLLENNVNVPFKLKTRQTFQHTNPPIGLQAGIGNLSLIFCKVIMSTRRASTMVLKLHANSTY